VLVLASRAHADNGLIHFVVIEVLLRIHRLVELSK
jgi:hypothetical protein